MLKFGANLHTRPLSEGGTSVGDEAEGHLYVGISAGSHNHNIIINITIIIITR